MQFAERIFKDVLSFDVDGEILSANARVSALELSPEVTPLDVKVQNSSVIDKDGKRTVCQMCGRLA